MRAAIVPAATAACCVVTLMVTSAGAQPDARARMRAGVSRALATIGRVCGADDLTGADATAREQLCGGALPSEQRPAETVARGTDATAPGAPADQNGSTSAEGGCALMEPLSDVERAWRDVAQLACDQAGFGLFGEVIDRLATIRSIRAEHADRCVAQGGRAPHDRSVTQPLNGICSSARTSSSESLFDAWRDALCSAPSDTLLGRERESNAYAGILCGEVAPAGFLQTAAARDPCWTASSWPHATLCIAETHAALGSNLQATYLLAYPERHPLRDAMQADGGRALQYLSDGPLAPQQDDALVISTARLLAHSARPEERRLSVRLRIARAFRRMLGTRLQYEAPPWRELLALFVDGEIDEHVRSLIVVMLLVHYESADFALQALRAAASPYRLESARRGYAEVWGEAPTPQMDALLITTMFHGVRTAIDSGELATARTLLSSPVWQSSALSRRQYALARGEIAAAQRAPVRRWLEEAAGCRTGEALDRCAERQAGTETGMVARTAATRLMSTWDVRTAAARDAEVTTVLMAVAARSDVGTDYSNLTVGVPAEACGIDDSVDWDCLASVLEIEARLATRALQCHARRRPECDPGTTERTLQHAAETALSIAAIRPSPGWATSRVDRIAARIDWAVQTYIATRCRQERGTECAAAATFFRTALCLNSPELRASDCAAPRPARSTIEVQFHVFRDALHPEQVRAHALARADDVARWSEIADADFLIRRANAWLGTLGTREQGDRALGRWLWGQMFAQWTRGCDREAPCTIEVAVDGGLGSLPFAAMDAGHGYVVADDSLRVLHVVDFGPSTTPRRWSRRLWLAPRYERGSLGAAALRGREMERAALAVEPVTSESELRVVLRRALPDVLHVSAHTILDEHGMLQLLLDDAEPSAFRSGFREQGVVSGAELQTLLTSDDGAGAWLVFLAGCRTSFSDGIGMGPLTGAARVARASGTENMVASLWDVDDEATAHLVDLFYSSVRSGLTVEDALRSAQRSFANGDVGEHGTWMAPRYWGAFIAIRN